MKSFTYALSTLCLLILCSTTSNAQWSGNNINGLTTRNGHVGIGLTATNSIYKLHVETANQGNNTSAIYGEVLQPLGGGDRVNGVFGRVESGAGWAYGVRGVATNPTPSNQGRSFGVYGVAGNATPGFNYGGQFVLLGDNIGAGIVVIDGTSPEGLAWLTTNGGTGLSTSRAGIFLGDVEMSDDLGIGCSNFTNPVAGTVEYSLFVNGGIRALELHVDNTSWCDYVFENTYQLTSLEEVATHIKENGHLHNTLSAAEIEANGGFELSEMTRNQQEKIEEIYLHLINLNKQIKTLQSENKALKKAIQK